MAVYSIAEDLSPEYNSRMATDEMTCVCVCVCVCGLSLNMEIALNSWINSLNTTSSLDIRVAPATRTRGEGGQRPPSPLVYLIKKQLASTKILLNFLFGSTFEEKKITRLVHQYSYRESHLFSQGDTINALKLLMNLLPLAQILSRYSKVCLISAYNQARAMQQKYYTQVSITVHVPTYY